MRIKINTDDNVEGREALEARVEAAVASALDRFGDRITRIEVHLSDENAGKSGGGDMRCSMEARPASRQPVAVTHQAATLEEAFQGADRKLRARLETAFGRVDDAKGAPSIRDNPLR